MKTLKQIFKHLFSKNEVNDYTNGDGHGVCSGFLE